MPAHTAVCQFDFTQFECCHNMQCEHHASTSSICQLHHLESSVERHTNALTAATSIPHSTLAVQVVRCCRQIRIYDFQSFESNFLDSVLRCVARPTVYLLFLVSLPHIFAESQSDERPCSTLSCPHCKNLNHWKSGSTVRYGAHSRLRFIASGKETMPNVAWRKMAGEQQHVVERRLYLETWNVLLRCHLCSSF